ncbi:MAG: beta-phosphoglucomutase [Saprospiraceae bacterium]|uniref:Beta-phosphoglucomutase n=1 Tax=Candidatus Opimibacter skivensis TaxID=2982028 RepID=A0A9D7SVR2_9BACT|nr:beta-phosphoglucomutase [Candidatus Opimibacter skivensis]
MKVLLSEIEQNITADALEEAQELVSFTQEYAINLVEEGYYHCISRQPDYHVEITIKKDGLAVPKCQCTVFKRTKQCKHAIAALLLLRDQIQRSNRSKKKSNQEQLVTDEVLKKLNVTELRAFLSSYALSHSIFRAEILSNYLHLIRNPNYHSLFMDIAPLDKYGQVRLNRNSIKTVRSVSSTLLRQAQQLLKDRALAETLQILEASILHLHRLWMKLPQFQEQLMVELRMAYKIFESLCAQQMAPRLQIRAINLSMEICNREGYVFPSGMRPLLSITEPFLLEEKTRKAAFLLAEKKIRSGIQIIQWATLLYRWTRLWSIRFSNEALVKQLETSLPAIILESAQQSRHDDVLYLMSHLKPEKYPDAIIKSSLQAGLKSARLMADNDMMINLAYRLALNHLDMDAWDFLKEKDPSKADRILHIIEDMYQAGSDQAADELLLNGWQMTGQGLKIIQRLRAMGQLEHLVSFDFILKDKFRAELEDAYAEYIVSVREMYGGVNARQKLNTIFAHLKTIDLFQSVSMKVKEMENPGREETLKIKPTIKGFVFDLDGVIVDTAVHHFSAWTKIMKELGVDIEEADDEHTRGAGRMESFQYLLDRYDVHLTEDEKQYWAARKNDIYVEAINTITSADLLPGALSFLSASKDLGLLLALGSASKNAKPVIEKLGVKDYFDAILDGNDAKASKPDPEIFINAVAALKLEPAQVVVFEDAVKGVQAALSAGCYAVGIGDPTTLSAAQIVMSGLDQLSPSTIIERLV